MTDPLDQSGSPEPPAPAAVRDSRPPSVDEPLELHEIQTREDDEQLNYSSPSASSGEEYQNVTRRTGSHSRVRRPRKQRKGPWNTVCRFWTHNVTLTVPQKNNRDHFALERTFLAYIRTSVVVAMQGVLIAQLFRLQRSNAAEDRLRFYEVGIPLAVACYSVAIAVALIGAYRFWRQQSAISVGKVHAGGWELNSVGILLFLVLLVTLILSLVILIEIDMAPAISLMKRILNN
ncbi:hypothetical protein N7462_008346 [Penicillium macrosclerotiorum]|uniref:uncharacterized protein n=1 Tax=Penicillium macrosclerotiorum TaxID=303699 RepID=UPI002548D4A1|nr:uncharacterized protein N7462_008346 [Penicillium macrosclerotiorum]KAJ5675449.1 hypothetical protein N7462_008346 [Penicillium macrosclerotiorum]